MAKKEEISLLIRLKDGVTKGIKSIRASFAKNMQSMQQATLIFVGAFAGVAVGVKNAIEAFKTQQRVTDQTNKVLESTGHAANLTAKEVNDMARALQKTTGVSDEVTQSAQNILLTFTNIKDDVFPDVTKVALDMTAAMNHGVITQENLKMQSIQLGKALNDPTKGLSALSRVGVTFTDQQKEQIKAMQVAGDTAGAQAVMLAELQKEFDGSSENLNTLVGAQRASGAAVGDMMEIIGEAFLPMMTAMAKLIKNVAEALQEWLPKIKDLILPVTILVGAFTGLMAVGGAFVTLGPMIGAAFKAAFGPIGIAISAISLLTSAFIYFKNSNSILAQTVRSVWNTIGTTIEQYAGASWEAIKNLGDIFKAFGSGMLSVVNGDFKGAIQAFKDMGQAAGDTGKAFVDASNVVKETFAANLEAEKAAMEESRAAKVEDNEIRAEIEAENNEVKHEMDQEFLDRKAEMDQIAEDARIEFENQKKLFDQMSAADRLKLLTDTLGKEKILNDTNRINELTAKGKFQEAKKSQDKLYFDTFVKMNEDTIKKLDDGYKKHWTYLLTGAELNAQQRNRVNDVIGSSFSDLMTLFGEESIEAFRIMQAASIGQTIMKTYEAAQSAFAALSGIPIVGPALGGVAAGVAVAAGLARAESIRRQRPPQAEGGAFAPGDGATVNIGEKGNPEWVLNEDNMKALLNQSSGGSKVINLQMNGETIQQWIIESENQKELMQKEGRL